MKLSEKKCVACKGGAKPLTEAQAKENLKEIPGWEIVDGGKWLQRKYKFKNFVEAQKFVNRVGEIAEQEQHHPDITFGWGYCLIRLQTHSVGGLHENDFIEAAKINQLG